MNKKVNSLKVDLHLQVMSAAFMIFYVLHIFKTSIKENTSVRAENITFCNYISTYVDNKVVLSRTDKKFGDVIFQSKYVATLFDVLDSVSMSCLKSMSSRLS